MKTLGSLEERQILACDPCLSPDQPAPPPRSPRLAAWLSLLPGLGQLYNGETGKGLLFLLVSFFNFVLVALICFGAQITGSLTQIAAQFHLSLNSDLLTCLQVGRLGSSASMLCLLLIVSYVTYSMRDAYDQALAANKGVKFAPYFLGLPEATSGSYLFHFAVVSCCLLTILFLVAPRPSQEQAMVIELSRPTPPPPSRHPRLHPKPKPDSPKPEVVPPKPVPPAPSKPQTEPPKPAPVAVAVPTTGPAPLSMAAPEATAPAAPAPASNGAGSQSSSTGTASGPKEVDFGSYIADVQKRIKRTWSPPKGNESKRVTVKFHIRRNGELFGLKLAESSGAVAADEAATNAVEQAAPFPPLPDGSPEDILIKFTFDYNVFNGRGG